MNQLNKHWEFLKSVALPLVLKAGSSWIKPVVWLDSWKDCDNIAKEWYLSLVEIHFFQLDIEIVVLDPLQNHFHIKTMNAQVWGVEKNIFYLYYYISKKRSQKTLLMKIWKTARELYNLKGIKRHFIILILGIAGCVPFNVFSDPN